MSRNKNAAIEVISPEERAALDRAIDAHEEMEDNELPEFSAPALSDPNNPWATLVSGLNSAVTISVTRAADAHRGKEAHLMRCSSDDYTPQELEDKIQATWGAGEYRIRGYYGGRVVFNQSFICENLPTIEKSAPAEKSPLDAQKMQIDLQMMQMQMMQNFMQSNMALMQGMAEMFKSLRPEPVQNQNQSVGEIFGMLASVKEIFQPTASTDPLALLKEGMSLAKEVMGGGSDKETNSSDVLLNLIQTAGPALLAGLQQQHVQRPTLPVPRSAGASDGFGTQIGTLPPRPPVQTTPPVAPEKPKISLPLPEKTETEQLLDSLYGLIDQGISARAAAILVLDSVTDDQLDQIADFLEKPEWIKEVIQTDHRFSTKTEWLGMFGAVFMSALDENDDTADTGMNIADDVRVSDGNQETPQ
jgi:hypothetical protein